jgi:hypothetical protein
MNAKYSDVRTSAEVLPFLQQYPAGQFKLPSGEGMGAPEAAPRLKSHAG